MLKRILSLACCLSLTVGLFTYRPPEAKAIVTEASLATSCSGLSCSLPVLRSTALV